MTKPKGVLRPLSLRALNAGTAPVLALSAALLGAPAQAQQAQPQPVVTAGEDGEVQLDTLKIEDRTADVNPHAQPGVPYKARVSADSRRTRPLAETPQTITVVTETQIKESGRTDLRDVLQQQPGVTVGTGENGNKFGDRYVLRGSELKSDVFVDGLRDPGMTIRESFNVEQVELTKGPSSTFAGRGSAGGAVNAITKKATTAYNFINADATGGTAAFVRLTGDANQRISDQFALRANGLYASGDVPGRTPASRERFGAALSALLRPSDRFSVLLDYYHLTARDRPDLGSYFTGPGGTVKQDVPVYAQRGDFMRSAVDVLTAKVKWDIAPTLRLENIARYGTAQNGFVNTGARGAVLLGTTTPVTTLDSGHQGWQQIEYLVDQLNLAADITTGGMKHNLILGGELSYNRVLNGVYALTNGPTNCQTVNARYNPLLPTSPTNQPFANSWCILPGTTDIANLQARTAVRGAWNNDWRVRTTSAYLMDTVDLASWLTLFGGVRLDHFEYALKAQTVVNGAATGTATRYAYSGNLWNFHAGASLKPSDDGQVYLSFGTATNINGGESDVGRDCSYGGFCAPAPGTAGGNAADAGFFGNPVKTTSYELGTKWELFQHRLLLTAAAFHLVKDGVFQSCPATDPSCPQTGYGAQGTLNTGRYKVDGVELGLVGNITDRLSGQAGATWARSRVLASATPADLGRKLANFADFQATAQLRYQLTDALALGGTVNHKSSMAAGQPDTAAVYSATTGLYNYVLPAYTTFDAFASYKLTPRLELRANVQNVGNQDYYLAAYRGGTFVYIGDRRRATLTLSGKF